MNYKTITLPSGLKGVLLPTASPVVYCGIAVGAGTRNEEKGEEGLAHFCEHLSFKGTERRSAVQIINALEGIGGELNAFTNKEDTVFYCAVLREHLPRAVDVLFDIVFHSQYPQAEVEKESLVVCDEIESYEDSPAELIFDEFEDILFAGHPLGHNILGTESQVKGYRSDDARRFTERWYRPDNCVVFASGDVDFSRFQRVLERADAQLQNTARTKQAAHPASQPTAAPARREQHTTIRQKDTHQAHVMLGTVAYPTGDARRWSLYLLNNILGGPGMNSRLNLALRERNALVYTVESSMVSYGDTGAWSVYFGCDTHDVKRCLRLVRRELDKLMAKPLTPTQLKAAKQQLRGQLAIACENRENFTLDFARNFLHRGEVADLTHVMEHVEALTSADLQAVARDVFAEESMQTLIYQ